MYMCMFIHYLVTGFRVSLFYNFKWAIQRVSDGNLLETKKLFFENFKRINLQFNDLFHLKN